jgi:pimeloyl-ACP methyl ester carboxylesterase
MSSTTMAENIRSWEEVMRRIVFSILLLLVGLTSPILPATAEEVWKQLPTPPALPEAKQSGYAPVNGIELYYAIYGEGPPLIMLHGGLGNTEYFAHQIPVFAKQYTVIAVDSRGHGRSSRDAQPYSYSLMASDVVALMDHLKIPKASLVGWSDGGIIGLDIAMNHPERVDKLFAFGANTNVAGLKPNIDKDPVFTKYIEIAGKDYARLSKTPTEYDAFVSQISEMWANQPNYKPDELAKIKASVAISDGEHDEAIRQEHNVEMANAIPGAKLVILPGVSHFAFLQNPEQFNRAVLDFLAAK